MTKFIDLSREEKNKFNEILSQSGFRFDVELNMPMPLSAWGTRKHHNGLQSYSKLGRKFRNLKAS